MDMVHINRFDFIDLTSTMSVHQGFETSGAKKFLTDDDFYWNKRFMRSKSVEKAYFLFNILVCLCSVC